MKKNSNTLNNIGHGCHRCPLDGKHDDRCITCQWGCVPSRKGQNIVSLDALLERGYQIDDRSDMDMDMDDDRFFDDARDCFEQFFRKWLRLPSPARDMVCERFLGSSWREIAEKHGITIQAAFCIVKRAKRDMPELTNLLPDKEKKRYAV